MKKAEAFRDANITAYNSAGEFHAHWDIENPGWLLTPWAGNSEEEEALSKQHKITIR